MSSKHLKLYFLLVSIVVFVAGVGGFVLPSLISARSDEQVALGVIILILAPVTAAFMVLRAVRIIKELSEGKN